MTNVLKPRFNKHNILNDVIRNDWVAAIENSPDSFQALLYMPVEPEQAADNSDYEVPLFNQVDKNQQALEYADPFMVYVLDSPDDMRPFVSDDGEQAINDFEQPMSLRIGRHDIPTGAILEWEEATGRGDDTRRCWWYVHSAIALGTTLSAAIHNVIPCRDFEGIKK